MVDGVEVAEGRALFPVERDPKLRFLIPVVVAMGFTMEALDTTILTTAIPAMAKSLHATPLLLNLAVTAYVLVLAVFIPISGWLADRYGTRCIFTAALAIFSLGSVLCGIALNLPMLVAARALQGFGGAMMTPVGRLVLLRSFPRDQIVKAMTYMTLPAIVGPVVGPLLGGALTTYASWRWAFFINIPFGLFGVLMALRFIAEDPPAPRTKFDMRGFLLFGTGTAALQFSIEAFGRGRSAVATVVALLVLSAVMFAGFVHHARHTIAPAVDLSLFRDRAFRTGVLAGNVARTAMNATPFLLPLMLQLGFGVSPLRSGMTTFVSVAGALAIRPLLSRLLRLFGFDRVLTFAGLSCAAVLFGFSLIGPEAPTLIVALYVGVFGLVRAVQFMGSNTLTYSDIGSDRLSAATSVGGMFQQLSVSFGVSLAAAILGLISSPALSVSAFHVTFRVLALLPLCSAPFFLTLRPETGVGVSRHVRLPRAAKTYLETVTGQEPRNFGS